MKYRWQPNSVLQMAYKKAAFNTILMMPTSFRV